MNQGDCFLKLDDIPGESQDANHKDEIDVINFGLSAIQPVSGAFSAGGGSGKVQMGPLEIRAKHSKASPKLLLACAKGQHIGNAVLTIRKAGGDAQEYSTYTLTEAVISKYAVKPPEDEGGIPDDEFSISYSTIEHQYKEQKPDGTLGGVVKSKWDVKQNKGE